LIGQSVFYLRNFYDWKTTFIKVNILKGDSVGPVCKFI
jgi:hypothetical protein